MTYIQFMARTLPLLQIYSIQAQNPKVATYVPVARKARIGVSLLTLYSP